MGAGEYNGSELTYPKLEDKSMAISKDGQKSGGGMKTSTQKTII